MWVIRGWALSHPRHLPPGRAAGAHYPLAVAAGRCGRGDPSPTPQRALLRAGFARCGGGTKAPWGGASCLGVGRLGSGALPTPTARPLGGLLGTTIHWLLVRWGAGVGTRHPPHSVHSCVLWGRHERARGGRLLPGSGASGVERSPTPDCPPSGRAAGAHYPLAVGAGGAGVGTRHQPHSTRSCALALRAVGAARGRPGGAPRAWVWGARGWALFHLRLPALWAGCRGPPPTGCGCGGVRAWGPVTTPTARALASCGGGMRAPGGAASRLGVGRPGSGALPPPTARPLGGQPGPVTHWLWVQGVRAWGPVTNRTARALASSLCALWGRHGGPRGRRLLPGCGASGVGRSPTPGCPPPGRAAGAHYPLAVAAGGCGRGDPSPTPQRALLRAGFARCGETQGRLGGAPPAWVWGVRGRALSHPRLPALCAGCQGPLPTGCGSGGVRAWRPVTNPTARALACCGGGMRAPRGGASCLGVGRPGSGALPPPTALPLGGLPGPTTHWLWLRGDAGVGTRHQPHSARSCELALGAVGAARGRPGGAPPAWLWGVRGRALSHPRLPALWAGCRGPLPTGCGCGGVRAWGPVTNPTARGHACCGGGMRAPGGGFSCLAVGRPGSGALPSPTARPLGGLPGPTTHWLWVRGVRAWGPVTNPTARALASWLCALWGRHEGARGGRLLPGCGAFGVGRSPDSDCPPSGRAAGAHSPLAAAAGGAGVGTRHQPHSARSCVLSGRHEGARGGRLLPGCGASGVGRSPTPDCPPSGRAAGAHYPLAVAAGGCRRGDPSPTPQRALLRAGFARCGGGTRAPGGGASCLGVGRQGSGALPTPTARPLGGLPGPTTHWLWVWGGAGVGTRHRPHSARSCVLWGRHEGAPGGAPLARVWGVRGLALSHPRLPALWAGCRGPLPTGCGGGMRAPGGGLLLPGCGASGVGRSPTPDCPPSGRAAGAHYPLAVGAA